MTFLLFFSSAKCSVLSNKLRLRVECAPQLLSSISGIETRSQGTSPNVQTNAQLHYAFDRSRIVKTRKREEKERKKEKAKVTLYMSFCPPFRSRARGIPLYFSFVLPFSEHRVYVHVYKYTYRMYGNAWLPDAAGTSRY